MTQPEEISERIKADRAYRANPENDLFLDWWPKLNAELVKLGLCEVFYGDARAMYAEGKSPEDTAKRVVESWSVIPLKD